MMSPAILPVGLTAAGAAATVAPAAGAVVAAAAGAVVAAAALVGAAAGAGFPLCGTVVGAAVGADCTTVVGSAPVCLTGSVGCGAAGGLEHAWSSAPPAIALPSSATWRRNTRRLAKGECRTRAILFFLL